MDDDFKNLRMPPDDEPPENPDDDDALAWLNALEQEPSSASTIPAASSVSSEDDDAGLDDNLNWLQQYEVSPEDEESQPIASDTPAWLQDDDPFSTSQTGDMMKDDFPNWSPASNEAKSSLPVDDDIPDWLSQAQPDASVHVPDEDLFAGLDEALGIGAVPPKANAPQPQLDDLFTNMDASPAEPVPEEDDALAWLNSMDDSQVQVPEEDPFAGIAASHESAPQSAEDLIPEWMSSSTGTPDSNQSIDDMLAGLDAIMGMDTGETEAADWQQPATAQPTRATSTSENELPDYDLSADFPEFDDDEEPVPADDDFLRDLQLGQSEPSTDWFKGDEEEAVAEDASSEPAWVNQVGDTEDEDELPEPDLAMAEDDFLAELRTESKGTGTDEFVKASTGSFESFDAPGLQDIDSLLASYENIQPDVAPATNQADTDLFDADLDRLLSDRELEEVNARRTENRASITGLSPDAPDWLTELGASVGSVDEVSAAAIVRKQSQTERSVDELSDRLYALHEAGMEVPATDDSSVPEVIKTLLPGVNQVLTDVPINTGALAISGEAALTDAQRDKINLLRSLVAVEEEKPRARKPSAIDMTLASSNLADFGEPDLIGVPATPVEAVTPAAVPKRRAPFKVDRLIISLIVVVAVVLPFFVGNLRLGELPPTQFAANSRQQAVYDRVDALQSGDYALIAAEYGPTGAAELDGMLDAMLRHVLMRGAKPVLVSSNPVGLLHARNVLEEISTDTAYVAKINQGGGALTANNDYYVGRYLAGEITGLRAFGQNVGGMLDSDIDGQPTQLDLTSLRDFSVIAVIAERAEDIRAWAEQIAPIAGQQLVIATGNSAAPLAEPYALTGAMSSESGIGGLLVGYRDAYTYRQMIDVSLFGASMARPSTNTPEPTQTEVPATAVPTEAATEEATALVETTEATSSVEPTASAPAPTEAQGSITEVPVQETTATTVPPTVAATATVAPTSTVVPSATAAGPTATLKPSSTPVTPTATVTVPPPTPSVSLTGVINADDTVNVREGPGRNFARVGSVRPGDTVPVLGRNADGTWIQIRLEDGTEGWVLADLITIQAPASATATQSAFIDPYSVVGLVADYSMSAGVSVPMLQQAEVTAEASAEVTPEATLEITEEAAAETTTEPSQVAATPTAVVAGVPTAIPYRDERWYGMTLGLIAIILVIGLGAIINIVRGLTWRVRK